MKKPFFSVIIPTLNEEDYISKLLKSINKQTFREFEVIIVDNGSTDKTIDVINKLESSLDFPLRIVHCKEKGISYARNFGVRYAKGENLIFFDADGEIVKKWMEAAHNILSRNKKIQAISGIFFHYPTSSIFKLISYNFFYLVISLTVLFINRFFFKRFVLTGNNFAIRKDAFIKTGMFPHKVHEDIFYSRDRFLKHYTVRNIRFCPRMILLNSPRRLESKGFIQTYVEWFKEYNDEKPTKEYKLYRNKKNKVTNNQASGKQADKPTS